MICTVVDFGMGNLKAFVHKLDECIMDIVVSSSPDDVHKADILILPGVGHFATAMKNLADKNLINALNEKVLKEKTPILGICVGMQLFSEFSEEGNVKGLGWIQADTKRFQFDRTSDYRIPHIGWNSLKFNKESSLLNRIESDQLFYFIHSYYVDCHNKNDVLTTTSYGIEFVSSIEKENIVGTQFHPEKSHKEGLQLVFNFLERCGVKKVKYE